MAGKSLSLLCMCEFDTASFVKSAKKQRSVIINIFSIVKWSISIDVDLNKHFEKFET